MGTRIKGYVGKKISERSFGKIYAFHPNNDCIDKVALNKYGNISIKGDLPDMIEGKEYELEVEYEKRGEFESYIVNRILGNPMNMNDAEAFNFLSGLTSDRLAENILKAYPDFIKLVTKGKQNEIDLSKINGVGEYIFNKIVKKIDENIKFFDIINEFGDYKLTLKQVKKMYAAFSSFERIKEKMNENPYTCLCSIAGIGFKIADAKILNKNRSLANSGFRMTECILHHLRENENKGNTWISSNQLFSECSKTTPQCIKEYNKSLKNKVIYYDNEEKRVSMLSTYYTEKEIAEKIKTFNKENRVYDIDYLKYDKVDEFSLTKAQQEINEYACKYNSFVLAGYAGCVDCDTEYFDGHEWRKISEYNGADYVMQYNSDGTSEMVKPLQYHKYRADELWHFETKYGLDQCLSDEHEVYYITSKNNLYHKSFKEVRENHEKSGFLGKFITTFDYEGKGLPYTDDEIRLMVAIKADGSFNVKNDRNVCNINVKKQRKKERVKWLLEKNGIAYTTSHKSNGFTAYRFRTKYTNKTYNRRWYEASKEQFKVIFDEIFYWDGDYKAKNRFFTTIKKDADFIQFVGTSLGYRASIGIQDRRGRVRELNNKCYTTKSIDYVVTFSKRTLISLCRDKRPDHTITPITKYKTKDGLKYCFSVPSGMLVLRRNNKIFITGNSGKTFSTKSLINLLDDSGFSYLLIAPTGKASKNLALNTDREAMTIHRALSIDPETKSFLYNEENPLPYNFVIVDEATMIDVSLMKHLLRAIDHNVTKLIFICDPAQIPSVGCGNCIHDIIESGTIPVIFLDKVFRYEDGGLAKVATDTRNGTNFITEDGVQKFGDDFVFVPASKDSMDNKILSAYRKMEEKGGSVDDIIVISAYNKGNLGTFKINSMIQDYVNPSNSEFEMSYVRDKVEIKFKVGDRVMQTVNNYSAILYIEDNFKNGKAVCSMDDMPKSEVFNGDDGKIVKIFKDIKNNKYMIVDFNGELLLYKNNDIQDLLLSYAISAHKSQGSGYPYVIAITPPPHKYFLNRNLLYVMYTRTKKFIYNIGTTDTILSALQKSENLSRNTHLGSLLKQN